jgi:hypothetical protein
MVLTCISAGPAHGSRSLPSWSWGLAPFRPLFRSSPEFEGFISEVRQILVETKASLKNVSYGKAGNYAILAPAGYITAAQSDMTDEAGRHLSVKYMLAAIVYGG